MKTVMYLLRHGTAEGQAEAGTNPSLSRLGIRQAEATRDFLAIRPIDRCYCSPLLRAFQTATLVAAPHGLMPQPLNALGDADAGEPLTQVHRRASVALDNLLVAHAGRSILVVGHYLVNRVYLAGLMGLAPQQAELVPLDNCGISVVVRDGDRTAVRMLNAAFHLQGLTASEAA
jgi:broad specificity phosphatase PhoE